MEQEGGLIMKNKIYKESKSAFSFEFSGQNFIDAETLSTTINNIIDSLQHLTTKEDPEAFVKLKVTKFRDGSFDIDLNAIVAFIPSLLTPESFMFASSVVSLFVNSITIKKFLKGNKPYDIQFKDEEATITNSERERLSVDKKSAQAYFSDNVIDNSVVNIFNVMVSEEDCEKITIKQDDSEKIQIEKEDFSNMAKKVVDDDVQQTEIMTNIIEVNLLLKKPDLLGNSQWGFVLDKNIDAKIEDEEWLDKVHSGKVKNLYAGVKIPVKLLIESELDKNKDPVANRYSVLEVTGKVIEPNSDNQDLLKSV